MYYNRFPQLLVGGGFLPESKAYFDAMTVQLDAARKNAINKFIGAVIAGGAWPDIGAMYIHTLPQEQQSLLNVINPTSTVTNLSKIGSPIWTPNVGWTGTNANANRLSSLGAMNNAEFKYISGNGSMGSYTRSNGTAGSRAVMGCADNRQAIFPEFTAGNMATLVQAGASSQVIATGFSGVGLKHGGRDGGTHYGWHNKTSIGSVTSSVVAPPNTPLHILTNNNSWPSNATTAFSFCGAFIGNPIRDNFVDAVLTLISDLDAI